MLVAEGVGVAEISRVMGKTLVSVRSKMYHLGLSVVDAAAVFPTIAVSVASIASVASTPKPTIDHTPLDAPSQAPIIDHQPAASSASAPCPSEVDAFGIGKIIYSTLLENQSVMSRTLLYFSRILRFWNYLYICFLELFVLRLNCELGSRKDNRCNVEKKPILSFGCAFNEFKGKYGSKFEILKSYILLSCPLPSGRD